MNRELKSIRKMGLRLSMVGAASAILLVSPAFGQSNDVKTPAAVEFKQLDENSDQKLEWDELQARLESVQSREWDQEKVMGQFDENDNDALEVEEYETFLTEVDAQKQQSQQTAQASDGQKTEVIKTDPAKVKVDPAEPKVAVQQKEPEVNVDQAKPEVTVDREKPEVTVTQQKPQVEVTNPKPEVKVRVPEPKVEVSQGDPDVKVQQRQPEVTVQQQKPEVNVSQGQPDVKVQEQQQKIAVQPAKPEVTTQDDDQQQANVQVEKGGDNAQVQVEQAEPEVKVTQAEPEVKVQSSDQADVNVKRDQQEQQQAQQGQMQPDEDAVGEVERMEAPAAGISSQQQSQGSSQSLDNMTIEELEGKSVVNSQGDELGEVDQVVIAEDQNKAAIIISMGGLLGIGAEKVLIPLSELNLNQDQLQWDRAVTKDEVKESDQYKSSNYSQVSANDYQNVGELKQKTGQ